MAISLVYPLNTGFFGIFVILGCLGGVSWLQDVRRQYASPLCAGAKTHFFAVSVAVVFPLLLVLLSHGEWPALAYDTDVYHAHSVHWMNEFGTPFGLANLHARLGLSSLWLAVAALLDNGPWDNRIAWIMPGIMSLLVVLYFLHQSIFSSGFERLFSLFIFPFILLRAVMLAFPSLYFDDSALFIGAIVFCECVRCHLRPEKSDDKHLRAIVCLAATAVMIKLNAIVAALFASVFIAHTLWKCGRFTPACLGAVFLPALAGAVCCVLKNAALSGWVLFPLPYFSLPLDFTVPKKQIVENYEIIFAMARARGPEYMQSLHGWAWLIPWIKAQMIPNKVLLAVFPFFAGLLLWVVLLWRKRTATLLFFGLWLVVNMVFWFFSAPDVRFGHVFFQMFFASGAAFLLYRKPVSERMAHWQTVFWQKAASCKVKAGALAFVLLCMSAFAVREAEFGPNRQLPPRDSVSVGTIPSRPVKSVVLDDSVTPPVLVYSPVEGDQCGNLPLPCTPYPNANLKLRVPGQPGQGFYQPKTQ